MQFFCTNKLFTDLFHSVDQNETAIEVLNNSRFFRC